MTPNLIVIDNFLAPEAAETLCTALLHVDAARVSRTTKSFTEGDPDVERRYQVIDGDWFQENAQIAWSAYTEAGRIAAATLAVDVKGPIEQRSDLVAKIYEPGFGFLDWHRDLNLVSGVLYLTECDGGDTEFEDMRVHPSPGRLVLFRGNLLHRANHVISGKKVNLIMNFYEKGTESRPDTYDLMLGAS